VESPLDTEENQIRISDEYVYQYMVPQKAKDDVLFEIVRDKVGFLICCVMQCFTNSRYFLSVPFCQLCVTSRRILCIVVYRISLFKG
jgi:hypothetical protein